MSKTSKKEYLVQVPHLSRPCTVRDNNLKPEYRIIKERFIPQCPECGNTETYRETWNNEPIKCQICGYPRKQEIENLH